MTTYAGMSGPISAAPPPSWRSLPRVVWLFGVASLLNDASSEAIFPLLGLYITTLGAPMRSIGLVLGLADSFAVGIKIAVGFWSDRVRRRPLVIGGYLVATAGRAAIALSVTPWQVLAARSLDRAGKAIRSGPRDAMLGDAVAPADRGRAYGVNQALDHVGAAIGPLVASFCLAVGLSLRTTFGIAAAMGLMAPLLLALRLREVPRTATPAGTPGTGGDPVAARTAGGAAVSTNSVRPNVGLRAYLCACGIFALANSSDAFILLRAADLGWSATRLPLLWLAHHVVKSVTTAVGGSLSDRIPRVVLIGAGWAAYAITYIGFAFATSGWHVLALLVFYAVYHGLAEAPERALVSDLAGPGRRGAAFGVYHGVVGFAALPAGLLMGWVWDRAGARAAFGVGAAVAGFAAALLVTLAVSGRLRASPHASPSPSPS